MTVPPHGSFSLSESAPSARLRAAARHVVFGKRLQPPEREQSYRRERLRLIGAELNLLLAYQLEVDPAFAHLLEEGEPALILGRSIGLALTVEVEPQTGLLLLYEESGRNDCVLITASERRLIDQIVGLTSATAGDLAPRTADGAVDVLVGRPIEEVERRLVLRTLLYFNGDRAQAALALGVDEASLHLKLRRYFQMASSAPAAHGADQ